MPLYNGTQKIKISGVAKVYVGTQLVYQNAPVLTSITLSGQTTSLNRGAAFKFGGTVTAHYSNGSTANVTSATTFTGYNMSKAGTYTVTASYTENNVTKTATYKLTVNKAWTAIWTGNKSKTVSTSAGSSVDVWSNISLTGSQTIRITFTMSSSGSGTGEWFNNGSTTSSKPGSPLQLTFNFSSSKSNIVGAKRYRSGGPGQYYSSVALNYTYSSTQSSRKFYITGGVDSYSGGSGTVSLTVTKIERYY